MSNRDPRAKTFGNTALHTTCFLLRWSLDRTFSYANASWPSLQSDGYQILNSSADFGIQ